MSTVIVVIWLFSGYVFIVAHILYDLLLSFSVMVDVIFMIITVSLCVYCDLHGIWVSNVINHVLSFVDFSFLLWLIHSFWFFFCEYLFPLSWKYLCEYHIIWLIVLFLSVNHLPLFYIIYVLYPILVCLFLIWRLCIFIDVGVICVVWLFLYIILFLSVLEWLLFGAFYFQMNYRTGMVFWLSCNIILCARLLWTGHLTLLLMVSVIVSHLT